MNIAESISPHLPYLRRFARALCGTQEGGDAYVVTTLELLVADRGQFDAKLNPKVALYRAFLKTWSASPINDSVEQVQLGSPTLAALTPRSRQAFLLTAVEGFTSADAAAIMDVDTGEFAEMLDSAAREIADQLATDVLIIEDEPIIAMDIQALVEGLGHTVMAVARTHSEAMSAVAQRRPGLVLADIHLADGSSGLDAVNEMLNKFDAPVIFITAYPERLLTGEKPEPAFLITKPFEENTLKAIISQALFFEQKAQRGG